ncbi:MAG: ribonuclease P protein component [Aeromicrobium sp.]
MIVAARVAPSCLPDPLLARSERMRSGEDFRRTMRRGRKGAQPTIVTHVLLRPSDPGTGGHTSVGFVVSKAVGSAVDRNRVKRQLRHLMRERVAGLPDGTRVVVRALPAALGAGSATLADHLDAALARAGAARP